MSTPPCRFCQHVNPSGAKFCNQCGSPAALKPCPRCDAIAALHAEQCHQCGFMFDAAILDAPSSRSEEPVATEAPLTTTNAAGASDDAQAASSRIPESVSSFLDESGLRLPSHDAERATDGHRRDDSAAPQIAQSDAASPRGDPSIAALASPPVESRARRSLTARNIELPHEPVAATIRGDRTAHGPHRFARSRTQVRTASFAALLVAIGVTGYFAYQRVAPGVRTNADVAFFDKAPNNVTNGEATTGAAGNPGGATASGSPGAAATTAAPQADVTSSTPPAPANGAASPSAADGTTASNPPPAAAPPATLPATAQAHEADQTAAPHASPTQAVATNAQPQAKNRSHKQTGASSASSAATQRLIQRDLAPFTRKNATSPTTAGR